MKEILYILYSVIFAVIAACTGHNTAFDTAFQPPVEEIRWGMMPEDVIGILDIPEESIQKYDDTLVRIQCEDMNVFGQTADVEMTFDVQSGAGLLGMQICFEDSSREFLTETLNEAYGDYTAVNDKGEPCQWESEKIEDMPEEIQEKIRYAKVEYPARKNFEKDFSEEAVWNNLKAQPLVKVMLGTDSVYYDAENMAGYFMLCDDQAFYE